jgi:CRP-like cAMP-binding protein
VNDNDAIHFHPESLRALESAGKAITLRARRTLIREGTPGGQVYLLTSGAVRVMRSARGTSKGALLWLAASPSLLGVEEALLGTSSVHDVLTIEPSTAIAIAPEVFRELVGRDRELQAAVTRLLAERIARLSSRCAAMKSCVTEVRLAQLLLDYAELSGANHPGPVELRFRLSQEMLAQDLQVSRRVVGPALAMLRRARLVEKRSGRFILADLTALARYAEPNAAATIETLPAPEAMRSSDAA